MKALNLDEQIANLETGMQRMQGQLDLLRALKQAGAVIQLPEAQSQEVPATEPQGEAVQTPAG